MPVDYPELEYEIEEMRREEFDPILGIQEVIPGKVTRYVTFSDLDAYTVFYAAYMHADRVAVAMRDGASDMVMPIFTNEGHSPGASASWLIEDVIGDSSSIARDIAAYSSYGEIAEPDGWIIYVYSDWRKS